MGPVGIEWQPVSTANREETKRRKRSTDHPASSAQACPSAACRARLLLTLTGISKSRHCESRPRAPKTVHYGVVLIIQTDYFSMHHLAPAVRPVMRHTTSQLTCNFAPGLRPSFRLLDGPALQRPQSSLAFRPAVSPSYHRPTLSKASLLLPSRSPPQAPPPSPGSSFFTPSICRYPIRHSSTTTQPQPSLSSVSSPPRASEWVNGLNTSLDWNTFFRLRASRRRYSLGSSILSTALVTASTMYLLAIYPEVGDQIAKIVPVDPMIGLGLTTFAAALLGWLIGPVFGNALWSIVHRSSLRGFTVKERAFFERIKKHRVNPAGASTNNPVPDFYGEKVGSVSGYRRWLKDQRAFNRKRGGAFLS